MFALVDRRKKLVLTYFEEMGQATSWLMDLQKECRKNDKICDVVVIPTDDVEELEEDLQLY